MINLSRSLAVIGILICSAVGLNAQVGGNTPSRPRRFTEFTVSTLPAASTTSGQTFLVTDGSSAGSCSSGGGSNLTFCRSNGTSYTSVGASGGGGGTVPTGTGFYHITGGSADSAAVLLTPGDIPGQVEVVANDGTTGTGTNKLVRFTSTGSPSTVETPSTSPTGYPLEGVCIAGCGTTGSATVQVSGIVSCVFDGATTVDDVVVASTTTAGDCHDSGFVSNEVIGPGAFANETPTIGQVLSTNAAAGTYTLHIRPFTTISANVFTVFGRSGDVIATSGDYTAAQVTNALDISGGAQTVTGVKTFSSAIQYSGSAPTCTFTSGGGTSPSCSLDTGSTNSAGTIIATTGTGSPGNNGSITLTFNGTFGTNKPVCVYVLYTTSGNTNFNRRAIVSDETPSTSSDLLVWDNNAVSVSTATALKINYKCTPK